MENKEVNFSTTVENSCREWNPLLLLLGQLCDRCLKPQMGSGEMGVSPCWSWCAWGSSTCRRVSPWAGACIPNLTGLKPQTPGREEEFHPAEMEPCTQGWLRWAPLSTPEGSRTSPMANTSVKASCTQEQKEMTRMEGLQRGAAGSVRIKHKASQNFQSYHIV